MSSTDTGTNSSGEGGDGAVVEDFLVGGRYRLTEKIAAGSFGHIFLGTDIRTDERVAVKLEKSNQNPQLTFEHQVLQILHGITRGKSNCEGSGGGVGVVGVPRFEWFGEERGFRVLVMELLGPSLEDLFNYCSRKFTTKTVLMLAQQLIERLEFIHKQDFIHRDVKPENFLVGAGENRNTIYIIDFGLSKQYRESTSKKHVSMTDDNKLIGTARYASLNTHLGFRQSRRDDLVSLGYVLIYFQKGSLPWQGLEREATKQKYEKICEMKRTTAVEVLCEGCPKEFEVYLNYCFGLEYDELPNYRYLKGLFRILLGISDYEDDGIFDWTLKKMREEEGGGDSAGPAGADDP